jgi:RimJ/RimL family protein N-acetyltransferase
VITLKDNQELVGMLGLRREGFQAEVGYAIARRFWGQGIVAETLRPVIDWTLAQPDIHRIWGRCDTDNKASARVMEKVGMKCEGLVPRSATHPNISDEPRDSYYYAIVK